MDFASAYQEKKLIIENTLAAYLPQDTDESRLIAEAMRYAVLNGGKRLRPILMMEAAALNNAGQELLPAACALEYIHCYSLVHDDLPAMDDDDLRRGKPTCHKVFGEDIAILAGDALLTLAFEAIATVPVTADRLVKAVKCLTWAAGWQGMVGGQVLDLRAENKELTSSELNQMHLKKTGALIKASLQIGGILTAASDKELQALTAYGEALGLAFQIMDDVLDVAGSETVLGKPVGSDIKNHKPTYVTVYGLEKAKNLARQQTSQAISALADFGPEADFLRQLAEAQLNRQF
ncbi:MAG: polyprenyl synthetase family protein [Methylocystaceae bacterium]